MGKNYIAQNIYLNSSVKEIIILKYRKIIIYNCIFLSRRIYEYVTSLIAQVDNRDLCGCVEREEGGGGGGGGGEDAYVYNYVIIAREMFAFTTTCHAYLERDNATTCGALVLPSRSNDNKMIACKQ